MTRSNRWSAWGRFKALNWPVALLGLASLFVSILLGALGSWLISEASIVTGFIGHIMLAASVLPMILCLLFAAFVITCVLVWLE